MYQPPPGPPPTLGAPSYAPPPGPPPPDAAPQTSHQEASGSVPGRDPTPPPSYGALQADPPAYETYNFQAAYQRWCDQSYEAQRQSQLRPAANEALPLYASRAAPTWYGVPFLRLHPTADGGVSFHLTGANDECSCPPARQCVCGRRHPPLWVAYKSTKGETVELFRAATPEEGDQLALSASKPGGLKGMLGKKKEGEPLGIKDGKGKKADVELRWDRMSGALAYTDPEGSKAQWQRVPASNEHWQLLIPSALPGAGPLATYQGTRYAQAGGVLSLDAFAWSRLMSEHIYCDFPRCQTKDGPLFGFRFRCETCTEHGDDSFDVCEACLYEACATHDATHRFVRIPRPDCEPDDDIQEVPLLRYPDLMRARLCVEGVLLGCAVLLLGQS